jgi:hypothetical protein
MANDEELAALAPAIIDDNLYSGYRSDAEQAVLFRCHADPKWVAPPGPCCTATAPSPTSARPPPAAGWPPTPSGSTSFSAIRTSRGSRARY